MKLREYIYNELLRALQTLDSNNYIVNEHWKSLSLTSNTKTEINFTLNETSINPIDTESSQNKDFAMVDSLFYIKARFITKSIKDASLKEAKMNDIIQDVYEAILNHKLNTSITTTKYIYKLFNFNLLGFTPDLKINENEGSVEFFGNIQVIESFK